MTPVWVLRKNSMGLRKGIWAILVGVEKGIHSIITGNYGSQERIREEGSRGEELGFGHKGRGEPLMEASSKLQGCFAWEPILHPCAEITRGGPSLLPKIPS